MDGECWQKPTTSATLMVSADVRRRTTIRFSGVAFPVFSFSLVEVVWERSFQFLYISESDLKGNKDYENEPVCVTSKLNSVRYP